MKIAREKAAGLLASFVALVIICGQVADADVVVSHGSFVAALNDAGGAISVVGGDGITVDTNTLAKTITIVNDVASSGATSVRIGETTTEWSEYVTGAGLLDTTMTDDDQWEAYIRDRQTSALTAPDTLEVAASTRWVAYDGASPDESVDMTYDTFSYGPLMSPGSDAGGVLLTVFPLTTYMTDNYTSVSIVWMVGSTVPSDTTHTYRIKANSFDAGTAQVEANYTTVGASGVAVPAAAYALKEYRTEFDTLLTGTDDLLAIQIYNVALGEIPVFGPVSLKFHN